MATARFRLGAKQLAPRAQLAGFVAGAWAPHALLAHTPWMGWCACRASLAIGAATEFERHVHRGALHQRWHQNALLVGQALSRQPRRLQPAPHALRVSQQTMAVPPASTATTANGAALGILVARALLESGGRKAELCSASQIKTCMRA